jgi:P27 family predicted phage terminase small subunit
MQRGPKPQRHAGNTGFRKPTALHIINGNPSRLRLRDRNEPEPPIEIPPAPAHLMGEAKNEWDRIAPKLLALRLLSALDRAALSVYCRAWAQHVEAEQQLARAAAIAFNNDGKPIINPWFRISKEAAELMHRFLIEFGMTPSSRVKLSMPLPPPLETEEPDAPQATGTGAAFKF